MSRCKKNTPRVVLFTVLAWGVVFLLQGTAIAHPAHSQEKIVSPFEETGNHAYCPLSGHHNGILVCPHAKKPFSGEPVKIASECGGNPAGQLPDKFGFNHNPNLADSSYSLGPDIASSPFIVSTLFAPSLLPSSLDHPPKSL